MNIEGPFKKMNIDIKDIINDHILSANNLLDLSDVIEEIYASLKTVQNSNTILCGNGGSASDSIHISSELVGKFEKIEKLFHLYLYHPIYLI